MATTGGGEDGPVRNYVARALELFDSYGSTPAISTADGVLTYAEAAAGVRGMAGLLRANKIRSGDGVALLVGNPAEAVLAQLALHLIGCRSVWLAHSAPTKLSVELLGTADVRAFIHDTRTQAELGRTLAASAPHLIPFSFGPGGPGPDLAQASPWESAVEGEGAEGEGAEGDAEPQSLFQTGGTTGKSKLVHHRHGFFQNVSAAAERYRESGAHPLRHLSVAGFAHASAQATAFIVLFTGGLLVLRERFDPADWLATVERERITSATLPPPLLYRVLDHPALADADTSSLQTLSCAGSAAAPARLAQAIERLGPIILVAYGLSEATLIAAYPTSQHDPAHPHRLASCGRPAAPVQVEIRNEDGARLPDGQVGEIWVAARLTAAGYWGEPELTAATFVDGWVRTGDLGYLDADGYLYLVDRLKDMIVTGMSSTNVYSRTVEDALNAHPEVRAAAVIGVPDAAMGEAVHAVVELAPDATVTPDELRQWTIAELNETWAPRTVEIVARLPLTDHGKVDKRELRAHRSVRVSTGAGPAGTA